MSQTRLLTPLRISPTPFKSSFLSIPHSPFSPRTPLTPLNSRPKPSCNYTQSHDTTNARSTLPPQSPLSWQWTCHQCRNSYPLAATRCCLDDGHSFCSGSTTIKTWRKPSGSRRVRRHRACASEFDYSGWKAWTRWRRSIGVSNENVEIELNKARFQGTEPLHDRSEPVKRRNQIVTKKNCWNTCSYHSECRWGSKFGIHTPVDPVFPTLELPSSDNDVSMPTLTAPLEGLLSSENAKPARQQQGKDAGFWAALIASAERRKSGSGLADSLLISSAGLGASKSNKRRKKVQRQCSYVAHRVFRYGLEL